MCACVCACVCVRVCVFVSARARVRAHLCVFVRECGRVWCARDALKSSKRSLHCMECDCKVSLCPNEDSGTALDDEEKKKRKKRRKKSMSNLNDIPFSFYNVELLAVYSSQNRQSFLFFLFGGGGGGREAVKHQFTYCFLLLFFLFCF